MTNILFYGDSNTWGFDPSTTLRYPYRDRWTTVCAALLGEDYNCIPAGMNGRTTAFDDPVKGARNGLKGLDCELQTHKPLDLFVVMLGTNDLKYTDAEGSADGMERLIELVLTANQRYHLSSPVFPALDAGRTCERPAENPILLISPIRLRAHVGELRDDMAEWAGLAERYRRIAEKRRLHFLDASVYAEPSEIDGVHLSVEGHRSLGAAIAEKIGAICGKTKG